jgi:ABC-type transport system involved in cytochrome c biogenesis permease subunit
MKKWFPIIITVIFAGWIAGSIRVPKDKEGTFALQEFGRLPVVASGRFQPLDSLARNSLLQLREKQTAVRWLTEQEFQKRGVIAALFNLPRVSPFPAQQWLATMMMKPEAADVWPVFRIDNSDLQGLLGLPQRAAEQREWDGKHFSWNQVRVKLEDLQREARRAAGVEQSHRTPYDQAILRLWGNVGLYMRLQNTLQPQNAVNWAEELTSYLAQVDKGVAAARAQQAGKEYDNEALEGLMTEFQKFNAMQSLEPPLLIPPNGAADSKDNWQQSGTALMEIARGASPSYALLDYAKMAGAWRAGDGPAFNAAVRDYRTALAGRFTSELKKCASEQRFNFFEPFYKAMVVYVAALVCALGFWVRPVRWEWLRRCAVWLVGLGILVHSSGLIYRMALEGRPPVTNLYSSAIFIGWGAVILGMLLERFWRNGIGIAVSTIIGFITLIIAHHLSLSGDTMEMMRAVLDTNIWLATHVVVVTLGYASTFVAGFLAIIYIVRGFFTPGLDQPTARSLGKMVYGIVCFATLFSFVGTVLGGIWADQSWGRFWGWDPKENGALIIVLWNALILHARWGGLVRERGLINMAIVGNIVTSWSWFGVNMLGIGLHSYGFMDAAFRWLMLFVGLNVALVAVGSLPMRFWQSFKTVDAPVRPERKPVAV